MGVKMGVKTLTRVETFLLLSLLVADHAVSSWTLCSVNESSVNLKNFQHLYVRANECTLNFEVESDFCGFNEEVELDLGVIRAIGYEILQTTDDYVRLWYDLTLSFVNQTLSVDLKAIPLYSSKQIVQSKNNPPALSWVCGNWLSLNVTFKTPVDLATACNETSTRGDDVPLGRAVKNIVVPGDTSSYGGGGFVHTYTFSSSSFYYTPLGIITLLVVIGLRYCIWQVYRSGTAVERVRTFTVVRRIHVPSTSSSGNATEPTPADPTDLPPSYADIENELPPPAYSELDNAKVPTGEVSPGTADSEAPSSSSSSETTIVAGGAGPVTETENAQLTETGSRPVISRVLAAGSRSLRSQFAFKPMKEEEE